MKAKVWPLGACTGIKKRMKLAESFKTRHKGSGGFRV